ncbi:YhcB family protein [Celerinatantimonas yamalensis]|uniref:Z-ring associated protein G n=1 Tax=Celerinatantimonas yamalensis TaxID=559956 RepID=A0ABW9GCY0_9GAMM
MNVLNSLILVAVGLILGVILTRLLTKNQKSSAELQRKLEQTQAELDAYQKQVNEHFNSSAQLLEELALQYQKIYRHMAEQSATLMVASVDQPLFDPDKLPMSPKTQDESESSELEDQPPKDYTNERSGILKSDPI